MSLDLSHPMPAPIMLEVDVNIEDHLEEAWDVAQELWDAEEEQHQLLRAAMAEDCIFSELSECLSASERSLSPEGYYLHSTSRTMLLPSYNIIAAIREVSRVPRGRPRQREMRSVPNNGRQAREKELSNHNQVAIMPESK